MPNPLFKDFGANQVINDGGLSEFINQVNHFRNSFNGNPREEVQKLLDSGQMSQDQFNRFAKIANQLSSLIK